MTLPTLTPQRRLERLEHPGRKVSMVLDTDAFNEIDDQFAIVYSLLSGEAVTTKAIYAAPFSHHKCPSPAEGMEQSYDEILRVLELMGGSYQGAVLKGSPAYLPNKETPVDSPAARHLVELAHAQEDGPLYVVAIGVITNVASAILLDPTIIDKIVVLWLGGSPWYWPHAREFNLQQDIPASQLILDCGVPLIHFPCQLVTEQLRTTIPEMERYVKGRGAVGDYLYEIFDGYKPEGDKAFAWSKVIWDIITIAWLVDPHMAPGELIHSPVLNMNGTWSTDRERHFIREIANVRRDLIFADFFRKLEAHAAQA